MRLVIQGKGQIGGTCRVPPDKSLSHRALIFGSFATGETKIRNLLRADDVMSTVRCLRGLGVEVHQPEPDLWTVAGVGGPNLKEPSGPLDCGNSGTTLRLLMGLLAAHSFEALLTGDASLQARPMDRVAIPLQKMGASVQGRTERYLPPILIKGGRLRPVAWELPVASAQAKTALLIAGAFANGTTTVVEPFKTRDHSERLLQFLGARVVTEGRVVSIVGPAKLTAQNLEIPGDPSSAAFLVGAAAAIAGASLKVRRLCVNPTRVEFFRILQEMGAHLEFSNEAIVNGEPVADVTVTGSALTAYSPMISQVPLVIDELPILAVLASVSEGVTVLSGAEELRVKESDRIRAMVSELSKMGAAIEERPDGWRIVGPCRLRGAQVFSWGDHRVAMSLAIAGLLADGTTVVENAECVTVSFPEFPNILSELGAQVRVE
ncbi:MAG: 3-phosphoshikimate 1-carboxyvinyltransferase [Armatimonadetes bacterium]|nr:3-phosphoshikimate 1-carboxyvinyltransferase [Armatimonadota bacterium]MDW8121205.1 3-phosphoshikimate 1-carboxyvinyltransferase [Armatimonadota bacterium]